jgi:hypothetical protein
MIDTLSLFVFFVAFWPLCCCLKGEKNTLCVFGIMGHGMNEWEGD